MAGDGPGSCGNFIFMVLQEVTSPALCTPHGSLINTPTFPVGPRLGEKHPSTGEGRFRSEESKARLQIFEITTRETKP